ncbi:hypothetical protein COY26_00115 [Candidatus Woesearchaeota archaeon CG_4_10_14_0_2_um_filter_33_10]|nr:MAG: hypothetical protein AUJ83_00950 [Candidatus Woesearchaeota archaeon CG1_02_33_12]PIN77675.1 MAG: hypothetical protein COV14_05370 [Candidatus Woesearchaeota archaeon CG10_big_fil_rev_8_21_14_0_10_33_12]PIU72726.1 MAG: hypothetical protein COS79_01450 [Candidatus Woesearchaeota archaeon CG06_land_8_20_14_3_00_33_13]PIZ54110.1 MAG: hypothetical protein COY26_00115 [Candidatus Woesearchaeota archaeon CG_4_10_14_0_2_um_filter_33_10]
MEKNQDEYYHSLNAKKPLADMVVEEAYKNQIKLIKEEQKEIEVTMKEMGVENISFFNIEPKRGERLVRRKRFVIGFNEIYAGEESKQLFDGGVLDEEQNKVYSSVEVSENGYTFGLSVKFPQKKNSIIIDSKKGTSIPINSENLENKLKEQGLNPSLVKKAETKYNDGKFEKEPVYQVFFNYPISEGKIESFNNIPPSIEDPKEVIKNDFRIGIREPLEKAIDCIVNLKLE